MDAMSPQQLNSLRNDVKHFVSERKLEEDLGKSVRFICDKDAMMNLVTSFGNRKFKSRLLPRPRRYKPRGISFPPY